MPSEPGSRPWYSNCRLHGSTVLVWSGLVRTRSPWLMSLVQVTPLLALPAKGLLSVAACGVHEPPGLVAVNERRRVSGGVEGAAELPVLSLVW